MTAEHSLPGTPLRFGALCGPAKLANLHAKWALSAIWLMLSRLDASSMSGCAPGLQPAAVHSGVPPCVYAKTADQRSPEHKLPQWPDSSAMWFLT